MGKVIITEQELAKLTTSAAKLRKELLRMPLMALRDFLGHVTLRTGIRYSETVGELTGHMVSIHAPTRGATMDFNSPSNQMLVSIHAPTRGATREHPYQ